MKKLKNNIFVKIGIITVLVLLLMIPTTMIHDLIREREQTQKSAILEVSGKWGNAQTLTGPIISLPYYKYVEQYNKNSEKYEMVKTTDYITILPESLNIDGVISPEKRNRGIFEIVVYGSNFNLNGNFNKMDFDQLDIEKENILFDKATINFGISDLKGIKKQIVLKWNDKELFFDTGTANNTKFGNGINVPIKFSNQKNTFNFDVSLKGSQSIKFVPVGKTTNVSLNSKWQTPSFTGNFLPDERTVTDEGFTANWSIFHLNRNFPQMWIGSKYNMKQSAFGTNLLLPVDNYQKNYRVVKYAILFLVLTFMTFFFVEILNKVFIHPIQYLLVGLGLVLFFTLLLSFSEHFIFNVAYFVATALTLSLISLYTFAILKSKNISLLILGVLSIMYLFIFTIIQLEGYSLLAGSLGLFFILALVMYLSRKIDWYHIKIGPKEKIDVD